MNFTDFCTQSISLKHWEGKEYSGNLRATWYGGWWECLIKMSLKKILGRARVSLVVLQMLIVKVEAILDDRPLTHVSSDVEDAEPLTPAHILYGHRITSLPHKVVDEQDLSDPTYGCMTDVS